MRAEASFSLGVNSDGLVVQSVFLVFFLLAEPAVWSPSQHTPVSQTHNSDTTRPDRHSSGKTEETEGQGVSLPFQMDSLRFYCPTPGTV